MMKRLRLPTFVFLAILLSASARDEATIKAERLFTLKVLPILTEKCFGCHDPAQDVKSGLDMTTREALLKGGETFTDVLVPGHPEKSFLMTVVTWEDPDWEMPPKENDRLDERQIRDLAEWIGSGAPWPDKKRQTQIFLNERNRKVTKDGMLVTTSGGQSDAWTYRRYTPESIWAFQPLPKEIPVPETGRNGDVNPIDAFIAAKLKNAGVEPAPPTDPRRLIRRASYGLTGLPPTPGAVYKFNQASKADAAKAWSDLVDRLLASGAYGERWAQHWLDVARYADTAGLSNDYERSNMWRYRDYVVRALNRDMPYDQFIREQIAGDELADASLRARSADGKAYKNARKAGKYNPAESEQLIASSFLRMGPWDPAMVKAPEARQQYIDDVLNAVGQTFLSTTMRCFKCHDHKFDPLPTKDYYRMYAVFADTQLAERPAPFLKKENRKGFNESKAEAKRLLEFASTKFKAITDKQKAADEKWYAENNMEFVPENKRAKIADEKKPPRLNGLTETEKGQHKVRKQDKWIWERRMERYEPMVQSVYNGKKPGYLNARKLRLADTPQKGTGSECHILAGGALEAPGDGVTPGVLSALAIPVKTTRGEGSEGSMEDPFALPKSFDGRRTGLAKWIANPDHPLTARSIVNRVWQYHFGKPLAGNPNNFGVKGAPPTHPELLDWLARDFVENGWRLKRLHKLILSSKTYRQSHLHPDHEALANTDPTNDLFAYFPVRRLSAEELRDGMLHVTGELNREMGGLPIKPEINLEVALQPRMIQFSIAPTYLPSPTPAQRHRRSIYAYRVRGMANPFLETFNQPNPNDSCEERDAAAVSPQAFTLLNSDMMTDRSIAFALRLQRDAQGGVEAQVKRAFHLCFGRQPKPDEHKAMVAYVEKMETYHADETNAPESRDYPTEITRTLVEEFSGQPFNYVEILPVYENFTPDSQPATVSAATRALADFCLLLFNSNEFVYVY